ncbi:MAG: hypothetical protein HKN24_14595, partial [Acidimicrobiales bacterium]|nr:hypothetical protein [Acidimicrobiales bacterium]
LRSILGDAIVRSGDGWRIDENVCSVDVAEFERLGRSAKGHRAEQAATLLADALSLWRGDPYTGVEAHGRLEGEIARLDALRLQFLEARIDFDLAAGRVGELIGELSTLVADHPYNERLRAQQMLALYRSGRQEEALRSFSDLRKTLLEDLGIDPSPATAELERRILCQDDRLLAMPEPDGQPLRGYRLIEALERTNHYTIWRAVQPSVKREVSIRHIDRSLSGKPDFIRQFEARAQTLARLDHPHLVPLIDFWRDPDGAYLVAGWLSGGSLASLFESQGFKISDSARVIQHVGAALAASHRIGVAHGGINASNIYLDEDGNAFLDGLAIDHASMALGLPANDASRSADVTALARLAMRCFAGGPASSDVALATLQREPLPNSLNEILERAADPGDTSYSSVDEFIAEFGQASMETSEAIVDLGDFTNPYKGLRAFDESDAADFFGRSAFVDEMVEQLAGDGVASRVLALVGPSGSGKSSVVRAGLVPAIRAGAIVGSERWFITTMTPGPDPFSAFDTAFDRISTVHSTLPSARSGIGQRIAAITGTSDVVLVIDQLEELFTSAPVDLADRFLSELSTLLEDSKSRLRVIATLRADHYGEPLSHGAFAPLFKAGVLSVTPLTSDELIEVIASPAHHRGLRFEDGLIAKIAADADRQSASLPLLQFTLAELVERRDGARLTHDAYIGLGGITGTIGTRAETIFIEADDAEREAIRRCFARLVNPDQSALDVRRRALVADLGDDPNVSRALARYGQARLLSFGHDPSSREPIVEVAHEALFREWSRLRKWLEEDRELIRATQRLGAASNEWHEGGKSDSDLYRGVRLEAALQLEREVPERLRATDRAFLGASRDLAESEQQRELARSRRLRRLLTMAVFGLAVAVLATVVAVVQEQRASRRANEAMARGLAATSSVLADEQLDTSLLLAANAADVDPSPATVGGLLNVLERARILDSFAEHARDDNEELYVFGAISLAADLSANTVRLFDTTSGEELGEPVEVGSDLLPLYDVELSEDGSTLVVATQTELSIWNTSDGRLLAGGLPSWTPQPPELRLSRSGTYLLTSRPAWPHVEVIRAADGESLGRIPSRFGEFFPPTFSPTEDRLVSASARDGDWLTMFSLPELDEIGAPTPLAFPANLALLSPDESLIALANEFPEASVTLLDAVTHEQVSATLSLEGDRLADMTWSPDSTRLAMASLGGEVLIVDALTRTIETRLSGHAGFTPTIEFLDHERLAVMVDNTLAIWDFGREPTLTTRLADGDAVGVDVRSDGTSVALVGLHLDVTTTDAPPRRLPLGTSAAGCGWVRATPFGQYALVLCGAGQNSSAMVIDLETGPVHEGRLTLTGGSEHNASLWDAALSPDGSRLALVGAANTPSGERRGFLGMSDPVTGKALSSSLELDVWVLAAVAWMPDGESILVGGQLGDLMFVDPETLAVTHSITTSAIAAITDISFDPDGDVAIVANEHGEVWLIDLARQVALGDPFTGSASQFQGAAISPDGGRLAAIGRDSDLRIWDTGTATLLTSPLSGAGSGRGFGGGKVRFLDNERLLTFDDGPPLVWDFDPERLKDVACRLAGRSLSDAERASHAPGLGDRDACGA